MNKGDKFLTITEAAQYLGITTKEILNLCKTRAIKFYHVNGNVGRIQLLQEDLDNYQIQPLANETPKMVENNKMTREELLQLHKDTCEKCLEIMKAKNADYSHGDNPFQNFDISRLVGVQPERGILVRVLDKMQRIRAFLDRGELSVKNESVEDAIEDIINYMILLKGMLNNN